MYPQKGLEKLGIVCNILSKLHNPNLFWPVRALGELAHWSSALTAAPHFAPRSMEEPGSCMKLLFCLVSNCSSLLLLPSPSVQKPLSYTVNDSISFLSHVPHLVPTDLSESGIRSLMKKEKSTQNAQSIVKVHLWNIPLLLHVYLGALVPPVWEEAEVFLCSCAVLQKRTEWLCCTWFIEPWEGWAEQQLRLWLTGSSGDLLPSGTNSQPPSPSDDWPVQMHWSWCLCCLRHQKWGGGQGREDQSCVTDDSHSVWEGITVLNPPLSSASQCPPAPFTMSQGKQDSHFPKRTTNLSTFCFSCLCSWCLAVGSKVNTNPNKDTHLSKEVMGEQEGRLQGGHDSLCCTDLAPTAPAAVCGRAAVTSLQLWKLLCESWCVWAGMQCCS